MVTSGKVVNLVAYPVWVALKTQAESLFRASLPDPKLADFLTRKVGKYPRELVFGGAVAMALIALFAFVISAGKEWVVAGQVLSNIPERYGISPLWQFLALVAVLLLGEVG